MEHCQDPSCLNVAHLIRHRVTPRVYIDLCKPCVLKRVRLKFGLRPA